jgi:hypothetical protein
MTKQYDADKILGYMMQGNSITLLDAIRLFGTVSLRERIRDLKKRGINIATRKEQNLSTKRFHAVYYLEQEEAVRHANLNEETRINLEAVRR